MFKGAFEEMRKAALKRLEGRSAQDIAAASGAELDGDPPVLRLCSFGRKVELKLPDWEMTPRTEAWQALTILHYLDLADGSMPSGRWIPMAEMKDGMIRGGGFDRRFEQAAGRLLEGRTAEETQNACARMGGRSISGNADLCAVFSFAPRFPVLMKLWFADEDFPASGRMFVDAASDRFLSIEDAVTVGEIFLSLLETELKRC